MAVGLPHPRLALTAFVGNAAASEAEYKSLVIGSRFSFMGVLQQLLEDMWPCFEIVCAILP
jgi:hypothetical protein